MSPSAKRLACKERVNVVDSINLACQEASHSAGTLVAFGGKNEMEKYRTIIYEDLHTFIVDSLGERFCRQEHTYPETRQH